MEMIKEGEIEQEYNGLMTRISGEFANELGYRNAENYVKGLLGTAERKNGWQLSEYIGAARTKCSSFCIEESTAQKDFAMSYAVM